MKTDPADQALARGRAYDLLGTGLLRGLRPDRVDHFRAVPALQPHIEDAPDPDQWAAAHHTALSLEVPPFQSAFLSATGHLDDGETLSQAYAQGGYGGAPSDTPADHIGVQLGFMAWLSGAEIDALRDENSEAVDHIQRLTARFIDAHLGRWLPALAVALQTSPVVHPFFREAALLTAELVKHHRDQLPGAPQPWALPQVPDLLEDPDTRLRDLACHLTTPSLAGGVLSRGALAGVGRASEVPKGFGSRALMLTNLLRSAAEYDRLAQVLTGLSSVASGWAEAHAALGATQWASRSEQTVALLAQMARDADLRE